MHAHTNEQLIQPTASGGLPPGGDLMETSTELLQVPACPSVRAVRWWDDDSLHKPHTVIFHHDYNFYHPKFKLFNLSSLLDATKNKCHALQFNIKYPKISPPKVVLLLACMASWSRAQHSQRW